MNELEQQLTEGFESLKALIEINLSGNEELIKIIDNGGK